VSIARHLPAILTLPGTALGLVPAAILYATRDLNPMWGLRSPLAEEPGLARRLGDGAPRYTRNEPRWIPCRRP